MCPRLSVSYSGEVEQLCFQGWQNISEGNSACCKAYDLSSSPGGSDTIFKLGVSTDNQFRGY